VGTDLLSSTDFAAPEDRLSTPHLSNPASKLKSASAPNIFIIVFVSLVSSD